MKSFYKHLGMVAIALLPALATAALQSGKVQVGRVSGTVSITAADSQRKPLAAGAVFQEGAMVETGVDSTAELVFSNGASVLLTPSTLIELRTFRQVPSEGITDPYRQIEKDPSPSITEIDVPRGKIIGEVRKLNALSTFSVKTPAGLVRIRGTVFTVAYLVGSDGIGRIVVNCIRGSVETTIYSSNSGPVTIDPGMQAGSLVPSAALINSVARSAAAAPAGAAAAALAPVEVQLYPIPAEELAQLATTLAADSTLPPEVAATVNAIAQTAPTTKAIFPDGAKRPSGTFVQVITDGQKYNIERIAGSRIKDSAPSALSNGGGGTTLDDNLKKISDNVKRTVEQKQLNMTPTGS